MLIAPFDMLAKANGFNILQYALDVYGQYQGISGAARRSWAAANPKKLEAYIRGYREGLAWLFEPKNKDEAIAIFRRNLPQFSEGLANQSYSVLVNPRGFAPDGALSIQGVRRVLALGANTASQRRCSLIPCYITTLDIMRPRNANEPGEDGSRQATDLFHQLIGA